MRAGDFTGQPTIYDPSTTVPSGTSFARTAFPNNQIPSARFDPAAVKLLAELPLPTSPNLTSNNYVVSPTNTNRAKRTDVKSDFQISSVDSMFARYSYFTGQTVTYGPFPTPAHRKHEFPDRSQGQHRQRQRRSAKRTSSVPRW